MNLLIWQVFQLNKNYLKAWRVGNAFRTKSGFKNNNLNFVSIAIVRL